MWLGVDGRIKMGVLSQIVTFLRLSTFETQSTLFANLASNFKSRGDFFFYFSAKK